MELTFLLFLDYSLASVLESIITFEKEIYFYIRNYIPYFHAAQPLQSVKKYLLSPSYVPNTILGPWWINSEQENKISPFMELTS